VRERAADNVWGKRRVFHKKEREGGTAPVTFFSLEGRPIRGAAYPDSLPSLPSTGSKERHDSV